MKLFANLTPYDTSHWPVRGRIAFAYGYWKQKAILDLPWWAYRVFAYFLR